MCSRCDDFRTPTLASIDRTCALLEATVIAQSKRLEQLVAQNRSLKPFSSPSTAKPGVAQTLRPRVPSATVARDVANTLNMESAGLQLKSVMLSTMKEPLLTRKVIMADESEETSSTLPTFTPITPQLFADEEIPETRSIISSTGEPLPNDSPAKIPWVLPPLPL